VPGRNLFSICQWGLRRRRARLDRQNRRTSNEIRRSQSVGFRKRRRVILLRANWGRRRRLKYSSSPCARPHNKEGGNSEQTYQGEANQPKHLNTPGSNWVVLAGRHVIGRTNAALPRDVPCETS
jgi:hypothetical protein